MQVTIINETNVKRVEDYYQNYYNLANKTAELLNLDKEYNLSLVFVDADSMRSINRNYRAKDYSTDVISFALKDNDETYHNEEVELELGDIVINVEAISAQSLEYGHSYKREALFLFVHGLLHLLGYDHLIADDEIKMLELQKEILDGEV
ncbi:MAG: rRNA maturation RNase YbeY [Erysipelotrichaceae bacterium]